MGKPKILVTTSTFPRWPGDTDPPFIYHLCKGFHSFEVHVLAPHYTGCPVEENYDGIFVHRYRYAPESWEVLAYDGGLLRRIKRKPYYALLLPFFLVAQWYAIKKLCNKFSFAMIHAHWIVPQGLVLACCNFRFILTSHGGDLYALKGSFFSWVKRKILSRASKITVVSTAMVQECVRLGVDKDKVALQPMGVNTTTMFVPPPIFSPRKGLLCVGRLVEKKGINVLIDAMSILKYKNIILTLTIIGNGPELSTLKRQVSSLGLEQQVVFLGAMKNGDLPPYYQSAEIFILPSIISRDGDQEGLGLVSVEAMACGCPVIASGLPAVGDVITDGIDGMLIEPGSSRKLADVIALLSADKSLRDQLAENGLKKAKLFDWQQVCRNFEALISAEVK